MQMVCVSGAPRVAEQESVQVLWKSVPELLWVGGFAPVNVPARRDSVPVAGEVGGPRHGGVTVAHCREKGEFGSMVMDEIDVNT